MDARGEVLEEKTGGGGLREGGPGGRSLYPWENYVEAEPPMYEIPPAEDSDPNADW